MKKFLSALLLVCAAAAVFAGCDKEPVTVAGGVPETFEGFVTLVLDDPETEGADAYFQVTYAKFSADSTAFGLLKMLSEEGKIYYDGYEGSYGFYFTSVGYIEDGERVEIAEDDAAAHTFVAFYTSVEKDFGGMTPIQYGGKTLETSIVGAGSMSLEDGAVIFVTESTY